jgi:hypothetical protein
MNTITRTFQWHVAGAKGSNNRFADGVHSADAHIGENDIPLFCKSREAKRCGDEYFTTSLGGSPQVWTLIGHKPSAKALKYLTRT